MTISRVVGECGLCRHRRELCKSHYIPKAIYSILRSESTENPNPILIQGGIASATSRQIKKLFLCSECEDRFSTRGETYTLAQCARSETKFRLRDALLETTPMMILRDNSTYYDLNAVRNVNLDALIYFAISMIWRASATSWGAGMRSVRLGGYQEPIRKYLLGEAPIPEGVFLLLFFFRDPKLQSAVVSPFSQKMSSGCWQHRVSIPGLVFHVFVGGHVDLVIQRLALNTAGPKLALCGNEESSPHLRHFARALRDSRRVGDLAKRVGS